MSADALQVYAGLETLTGVASPAERAQLEHRLISFLPLDATFSAGQYAELAHAEIDGLLAVRAATDRRRRHRPVPARGARRARPAPAAAGGRRASAGPRELERRGRRPCTPLLASRAAWAAEGIDPNDRQRVVRALELLDAGELEPPRGRRSCGAPSCATRRCSRG